MKREILTATEAVVGKKVYIGSYSGTSEKHEKFVEDNYGFDFEIIEVGNNGSKLAGVPFRVSHADLKKYKSKTTIIEDIIKTHICEDIFQNGYPTELDNLHPYDFFMRADVDCTIDVESSPLCTEWNFEVAGEYALDNIRAIRGLMQSMYSDLKRLKNSLFLQAFSTVKIYRDEMISDLDFYETADLPNVILKEQGTEDEHIVIIAVDAEIIS